MKLPFIKFFSKVSILGLVAVVMTFGACTPEDENFNVFTPVDFIITADATLIEEGNSITFNDESVGATGRDWSFEGGAPATSSDQSPTVNYAVAGTYFTNVTTSFSDGRQETRSLRIQVVPPVVPNFSASPSALQAGGDVQFNNLTAGVGMIPDFYEETDTNVVFQWVFEGLGTDTVTANKPVITYNEVGTYDVTLVVTRRSTNSKVAITKSDFITVLDVPVTQARSADFDRDGSSVLLALAEEIGTLPADAANKFTLSASGGGTVAISGVEGTEWGPHIIKAIVDPGSLTTGETYTLSFSDVGSITTASGNALLSFSYDMTYLGQSQAWEELNFNDGPANNLTPITSMLGGKEFTFTPSGVTFVAAANTNLYIFNQGAAALTQTFQTNVSPYTMTIAPGADASLSDLGDVGLEMGFLGPNGTVYTFSQPITDLRFVNGFGNPDFIPEATLSPDGMTMTITKQGNRNQAVRISAILEGPINEEGLTTTTNAPQGVTIYVTASGR